MKMKLMLFLHVQSLGMKRYFLPMVLLPVFWQCSNSQSASLWVKGPDNRDLPRISAHRGGRNIPGYPENCVATFDKTLNAVDAMIECDVSMTADSILILMHDNTLDRTTTGSGKVNQQNWDVISTLRLEDDFGLVTDYTIPRLDSVLAWARGRGAILTLDIKRGVPFAKVLAAVAEADVRDQMVMITYNTDDAQTVHALDPDILISVSIRNMQELAWVEATGIPADRLLAFTGTTLSTPELYAALDRRGIPAMLGTLGNLDKMATARGDQLYREFLEHGVDILATDRPEAVGKALKGL